MCFLLASVTTCKNTTWADMQVIAEMSMCKHTIVRTIFVVTYICEQPQVSDATATVCQAVLLADSRWMSFMSDYTFLEPDSSDLGRFWPLALQVRR